MPPEARGARAAGLRPLGLGAGGAHPARAGRHPRLLPERQLRARHDVAGRLLAEAAVAASDEAWADASRPTGTRSSACKQLARGVEDLTAPVPTGKANADLPARDAPCGRSHGVSLGQSSPCAARSGTGIAAVAAANGNKVHGGGVCDSDGGEASNAPDHRRPGGVGAAWTSVSDSWSARFLRDRLAEFGPGRAAGTAHAPRPPPGTTTPSPWPGWATPPCSSTSTACASSPTRCSSHASASTSASAAWARCGWCSAR